MTQNKQSKWLEVKQQVIEHCGIRNTSTEIWIWPS